MLSILGSCKSPKATTLTLASLRNEAHMQMALTQTCKASQETSSPTAQHAHTHKCHNLFYSANEKMVSLSSKNAENSQFKQINKKKGEKKKPEPSPMLWCCLREACPAWLKETNLNKLGTPLFSFQLIQQRRRFSDSLRVNELALKESFKEPC